MYLKLMQNKIKYLLCTNSVLNGTLCPFYSICRKGQIINDDHVESPLKTPENFINMSTTTMHMKIFLTSWQLLVLNQ